MLIVCRLLKKMSFRVISERYLARNENQLRGRYFYLKKTRNLEEMRCVYMVKFKFNILSYACYPVRRGADGNLTIHLHQYSMKKFRTEDLEKAVNKNQNAILRMKMAQGVTNFV